MIIVAASIIGICLAVVAGADLRRLALIHVRHLWLVWASIGIQVGVLTYLAEYVHGGVGNAVHLGTYLLAGVFVIVNRHIRGVVAIGVGAAMNVAAIVANGGVMPASVAAWEIAGFGAKVGFNNSVPVENPKLLFLGDVFAVPAGWPLANVFSAGDVILVLGLTWMVYRAGVPDGGRFGLRLPDGYVMVRRTDEHRLALVSARERLGELIQAIEHQADDVRHLTMPPRVAGELFAEESEEWRGLLGAVPNWGAALDDRPG